ncbi:MAG: DUF1924 domain-containing protein, partial [Betaproteobacteria bacterium]
MRLLALLLTCLITPAVAQPTLLDTYRAIALKADPRFIDFSSVRGERLFHAQHGDLSCATCHTKNPKAIGQHPKTGKAIEPLAPVAHAQRLTDPAKVEKWFKRNCNEVLQRPCTALEKGDFVLWLMS